MRQEEIDNNPNSAKYQFCIETFRISKVTDFKTFHNIVTDYWGLEKRNFRFYDDNGDILEDEDTGI